ncbi:fatty acid synthase-like protein [Leptotrombidium deliense]|uniref:Fatty acid synthase-like protein n=1 Tax=Leptotrombidium deliense TaxID=299467 RepID=A0A443S2M2_9ACAR|nr:fatty acid synthase-like protein [Leptotrombidium deliense]
MMHENDIVISGISGRYPNSDNVYELWNNLTSGQSMLTTDDQRWPLLKF